MPTSVPLPQPAPEAGARAAAATRFWSKVAIDPSGCWEWTDTRSPQGYGQLWWRSRSTGAHRVSFELTHGRPPLPGLVVRHVCDHRPCVRPDHLIEGTHGDNLQDQFERGRRAPAAPVIPRLLPGTRVRVIGHDLVAVVTARSGRGWSARYKVVPPGGTPRWLPVSALEVVP